jgi:hypothetical protein
VFESIQPKNISGNFMRPEFLLPRSHEGIKDHEGILREPSCLRALVAVKGKGRNKFRPFISANQEYDVDN